MPSNTTYRPARVVDFEYQKLNYAAQGVMANPTINTSTNVDLYMAHDYLITGFWITGGGTTFGDKVTLQAIDTDNIFGYGAGTVLNEFATDVYLPANSFSEHFDVAYPAKIFAGLSLRIIYTSVATTGAAPSFAVNYKLHKVLI